MRIELKKVTYSAALSEETNAFTADIWINGKKAGTARNSGHGGCTDISPHALCIEINEYAKTLPMRDIGSAVGAAPMMRPQSDESIVDGLLISWVALRDLKRSLKNRALYTKTDKPGIFQTKVLTPMQMVHVLTSADVKVKWCVGLFLNAMPEADALALYVANA